MASYNKVMLMGNLTRDPEVRYTPKGSAVAELGLAISRKYTTGGGEQKEDVTFVDVTLWSKLAELAGQYLKKGNPVFIEGRLQLESWEDKQSGQKRSKLKVVGEVMQLIGGKPEGGGGQSQARPAPGSQQRSQGRAQHGQTREEPDYGGMSEDEIPFACPHYLMVGGV